MFDAVHLYFRWLHVIAGIAWIGHLYFFNFVNIPLQGSLDDATKKAVNPQLLPRALFWFRWGAMITFLAGLVLFTLNYMYAPGAGFGPTALWGEGGMSLRAWWILMGMAAGTVMWFNVWFVIWPAQKKILGGKVTGDELAATRKTAVGASRVNTFLSGPMLLGMLGAPHAGNAASLIHMLVFVAIAMFTVKFAYGLSTTDTPKSIE